MKAWVGIQQDQVKATLGGDAVEGLSRISPKHRSRAVGARPAMTMLRAKTGARARLVALLLTACAVACAMQRRETLFDIVQSV